jgi:hypothetical protein
MRQSGEAKKQQDVFYAIGFALLRKGQGLLKHCLALNRM